jgi:hypothetical protein
MAEDRAHDPARKPNLRKNATYEEYVKYADDMEASGAYDDMGGFGTPLRQAKGKDRF